VTVLRFGALSDRSTFTSTDARAMDLTTIFLEELLSSRRCCHKFYCVLAAAGDVLTQQHQHQTEASVAAAAKVCLKGLKLSPPYLYSGHCSSSAWKF
jgi:hypothetical protein